MTGHGPSFSGCYARREQEFQFPVCWQTSAVVEKSHPLAGFNDCCAMRPERRRMETRRRREQARQPQEEYSSLRSEGARLREKEHRKRLQRLIPLGIFTVIVLLIAREEIPAVDGWITRLLDEPAWNAAEHCRAVSRNRLEDPGFARLQERGKARKTANGYYVDGVVFALLLSSGEEQEFHFGCNVSPAGEIVAISMQNRTRPAGGDSGQPDRTAPEELFRDP